MSVVEKKRRTSWWLGTLVLGGLVLVPADLSWAGDKPRPQQSSSSSSGSVRPSPPPRASAPSRSSGSRSSSRSSASRSSSSRSSSRSSAAPRRSSPTRSTATRPSAPRVRTDRSVPKYGPKKYAPVETNNHAPKNKAVGKNYKKGENYKGNKYRRRSSGYYGYGHNYGYGHHYHYAGCGHYSYGYYGHPYFYYGPYGYHYRYSPHVSVGIGGGGSYYSGEEMGALDLDIRPEKAQIFVNGEYVGVADQYDGYPGYLWLEKGTYDIVFFKEGYETISRQYSVYPGSVVDVGDRMVAGEAKRPEDLISKSTVNRDERLRRDRERAAAAERLQGGSGNAPAGGVGRLHLEVWPEDTAVYLDGNFLGTSGELAQLSAGLVVEPGEHLLELVRPGYVTEERSIKVPGGETLDVSVELKQR